MLKLVEKWWFKWVAVGVSLTVISIIFGSGIYREYSRQKAVLEAKLKAYRAQRNYEDQFQASMTRIYQNLKLEHYLAAYQNIRRMTPPKPNDKPRIGEYEEALHRIGEGLLAGNLYKESEEVFALMREYEPDSRRASEGLTEIESKRRLSSAQYHLAEAERWLNEQKYRLALADLQKADIELNATRLRDMSLVIQEKERKSSMLKIARYHVLVEEAARAVDEARNYMNFKDFKEMQKAMAKAARKIGVAAFYNNTGPEVQEVRRSLHDLNAELAVELPNSMPVWNRFERDHAGRSTEFFYLVNYHLDPALTSADVVRIGLDYMRHRDDRSFIVRYRIYLDDGTSFFNGHFLIPVKEGAFVDTDVSSIVYEQEVPEVFRGKHVQRIEVNIYTEDNILLSRVMRAFRRAS